MRDQSALDNFIDGVYAFLIVLGIIASIICHFYLNKNWLDFAVIVVILILFYRKVEKRNNEIRSKSEQINKLNYSNQELNTRARSLTTRIDDLKKCISEKDVLYEMMRDRNSVSMTRMASLYADFITLEYDITARYLETKKHPALKMAKDVRELKIDKKKLEEQHRIMLYKYELLLSLFPELTDYVDDTDEIMNLSIYGSIGDLQNDYDRVKDWIPKEEYQRLNENTRNQLALDQYIRNYNKSNWQIGRDYELYCGHLYRKDGWQVCQFGIERRLEDMGRDIIARKDNVVHVIQCKLWAQNKTIHENHIAQLYGSTIMYSMAHNDMFTRVVPVFVTNIDLSEVARKFADKLGVIVLKKEMEEFPRIKCNVNNSTNEKIYHLPFDQQYDRTKIDEGKGEFYAFTIEEAVKAGFRRAFKYHG